MIKMNFLAITSLLFVLGFSGCQKAMTVTESKALEMAAQDHTAYFLPADKLETASKLSSIHVATHFIDIGWSMLALILLLQLGWIGKMRDHAERLSPKRWQQCFVFSFEFILVTSLLSLPISLFSQHIQLKYGLSVQTWPSFFLDQLKGFGLTYVFESLGILLLYYFIRKFPKRWWLAFWFPTVAFIVLAIFLQPYVIEPMFNHFEPLLQSNAGLVDQLEKVVARGEGIQIPPERMFLMKASEKETTLNAYVSGFGSSKRVVVWDTSIAKGTSDEISFIFGHEMGHYVLGHIVQLVSFSCVMMLFAFFFGFHLFQWMLARFGTTWKITSQNDWASLPLFIFVLVVVSFFMEPIGNTVSRNAEHAADVFGQEAVHGIVQNPQVSAQAAFQLLGETAYSNPYPSAFVEFWMYSHPPIGKRAAFAKYYDPWAPGEAPKYLK